MVPSATRQAQAFPSSPRQDLGADDRQPFNPSDGPADLTAERIPPSAWATIDDWDDAVDASSRPSVFLTRDWLSAWWAHFGAELEPVLIRVAGPDGRTVGLAPLYVERPRLAGPIPLQRLGLIGDKVVGFEYLGIVARAGLEAEVARAVAGRLAVEIRWDVAELHGLPMGDPAADALEAELGRLGGRRRVSHHPCAMIHLPSDFHAYVADRTPKFRRNVRRGARWLERTSPSSRTIRTEQGALEGHLARLWEMHQDHWTALGYSGSFADPRMRAFYVDISRRLLAAGTLRFLQLEIDGVIRASQFGFVHNGVLHALQEAYDTTFDAPGLESPGVILRAEVLRDAIESEQLRGYDFLGGVGDFKTRWGTQTHYIRIVEIAARGPRGWLAWQVTVGARDLVQRLVALAPRVVKKAYRRARSRLRHR